MKNKKKNKIVSALLGITMVASLLTPMVAYAADSEENTPPSYEEVKGMLEPDEVVEATDIEILQDEEFDVNEDLTGLIISDGKKVKVQLYDVKNDQGKEFGTKEETSFHTRYTVEPVSGNPKYLVERQINVKAAQIQEDVKQPSVSNETDQEETEEVIERSEVSTYSDPYSIVVRNATPNNPEWTLPMLDYLKSSEYPGGYVGNHVKYIQDDASNGWRVAYCAELSKHFEDATQYVSTSWSSSKMYSEMAYAIEHGCSKYLELNDKAYSTGDWKKDYYVTQTVLYCILSDYGYDGHSFGSLSVAF